MDWEAVSLQQFLSTLMDYRDRFYSGKPPEERYYIEVYSQLKGASIVEKAFHVDAILLFLNRWKCRFSRLYAPDSLADWIRSRAHKMEEIASLSIDDSNVLSHEAEIDDLYSSLLLLKQSGIHNMSAACASKMLHLMIPALFVMWDANIIPHVGSRYGAFQLKMHRFAVRLKTLFAEEFREANIEVRLQHMLGYPVCKPLAKYIDEYNWHRSFGHKRRGY